MIRRRFEPAVFATPRNWLVSLMLGWPRPAKRLLMLLADLVVVPTALWMAFALKFDSLSEGFERNPMFYVVVAAASTLIFAGSGLYRAVVRFIGVRVLLSVLLGVTGSAIVLWVLSATIPVVRAVPFSVAAIFWLLALVWVTATRLIARWLLTPFEVNGTRVVIYGAGDGGGLVIRELLSRDTDNRLVGFIDDDPRKAGIRVMGYPVLGGHSALTVLVNSGSVDAVVISARTLPAERLHNLTTLCSERGVRLSRLRVGLESLVEGDENLDAAKRPATVHQIKG